METDERTSNLSPKSLDRSGVDRWRTLSETLASEVDSAHAESMQASAERADALERLRNLHVRFSEIQLAAWRAERDMQGMELALTHARDHIARTQPLLRALREKLVLVHASKFWKLRNSWFALKRRLKINSTDPDPDWLPEPDIADGVWARQLSYGRWQLAHRVRETDLQRMREVAEILPLSPTFSVIMPVYEVAERYLREAIESVVAQVYPHWQLCIADDASRQPHVQRVLKEYAERDSRIKLVLREQNGHISASSNSALDVATGDFVVLMDHDDVISPDALFENALLVNRDPNVDVIYSDEDKIDENGTRSHPYFKPDWAPDSLMARNYVSHLGVYRRTLVEEVGRLRVGFEGSQDYDLLLRITEKTDRVRHIPRVLYHWRVHAGSTASSREQKGYAYDAGVLALQQALERRGEPGRVIHDDTRPGVYTVRYDLRHHGKVSIIVPTRDHGDDVDLCFHSLFSRSTYRNFEVILVDNGSRDASSLKIFGQWLEREPERVKLVQYDAPFNYSAINNFGVSHSSGEYLLFLNNDTEIITDDWIEAMLEQAQRPAIGAVGAKLLYNDNTVQHAGVIIGLGGVAGHSHKHFASDDPGYFYTLQTVNNFSAVTAACLMVRRDVFEEVGGFDESMAIAFNDVDFCLKIRAAGYRNIYLPHVVLFHYESKSRGYEDTAEKQERFLREQRVMHEKWQTLVQPDPYYNINLSRDTENFDIGV